MRNVYQNSLLNPKEIRLFRDSRKWVDECWMCRLLICGVEYVGT